MTDKFDVLKNVFGYPAFRPGQEVFIDALLSGRDVLGIMPTGGGKSLCYQVPALCLSGTALVISPLIALIDDQVAALRKRGVRAASLHSGLDEKEMSRTYREAGAGELKLLYLSPERLENADFLKAVETIPLSLICVDEAHCISKWGEGFRPSYRRIGTFLQGLEDRRPPVIALTATASFAVRDDILSVLQLRDPLIRTHGFNRPNLYFAVEEPKDKTARLLTLLSRYRGECGIIYCLTRRTTEYLAGLLQKKGIPALCYHAGLSKELRDRNQKLWTESAVPVMVATNAFGMGIDKADVRFVIHFNMPRDMESYYQEAGRAGRDGRPSDCILFYQYDDVRIHEAFLRKEASDRDLLPHTEAERRNLRLMQAYVSRRYCLRAFMRQYFGERSPSSCGFCSVCLAGYGVESFPFDHDREDREGAKRKTFFAFKGCLREKAQSEPGEDPDLYTALNLLRARLAKKKKRLPSKLFTNDLLHEMALVKPTTFWAFLLLSGMTPLKAIRYGRPFLFEIRHYLATRPPGHDHREAEE